jgi:membrane protein YdbS with pleckstrin-like domain/DNA-binding HxlR family transcriptional regulator
MLVSELAFESEWVLKAITNKLRRRILYLIKDFTFMTYSDLLRELNLSTGKLNFHLRQLTGLIEKKDEKSYVLTSTGLKSLDLLKQLEELEEDKQEIIEHNSFFDNLPIRIFKPASETLKKWHILIYVIIILASLVWSILCIYVESIFPNLFLDMNEFWAILAKISIGLPVILVAFLIAQTLSNIYFRHLEYDLLDTEIILRKGVITETKTIIPFRTITNLHIKRGPLDRYFGTSSLIIQTAGESKSNQPAGKIIGIYYPHKLLEEIMNLVRLLDTPRFLREHNLLSSSPLPISTLYGEILSELKHIKDKVSKQDEE